MQIVRKVKLLYGDEKKEKTLLFKEVNYEISKEMMLKNHYSHKWNTAFGKINIGVFENETLLGIASFGNLMNPNSYVNFNKNFTKENVIELNRLWVDDTLGKNTETILLSSSWKIIREKYPEIKVVQSFADGRLGCGTIYKASNFKYYGYSESIFYEDVLTKETHHKVPMENTKRPDGMIKLNTLWVIGRLKPFKVKTYRYAYSLYKNIEIELKEEPYPIYEKGFEYLDIRPTNQLILRSFILSVLLNYEQKEKLQQWVLENTTKDELKIAFENSSIEAISKERNVYEKYCEYKQNNDNLFLNKKNKIQQLTLFDF